MPDAAVITRTALGAVAAWEGRNLSLVRPRRTQLPCWIAAIALHAVAAAMAVVYDTVPAPHETASIPVEFVTIEVAGSDVAPLPAEPAVEAVVSQPDLPPPVPVVTDSVEPVTAEPSAAPPPLPARIVDPPPPRPREAARRSPPPAPQPPPSAPAAAGADVPLSTVHEPAPAMARPPLANGAPGRESDYIGKLLGWLERFKEYPRAARLRRIEGQVMLELSIMADGQIASVRVVTGSGHAALDDAALDMVRRAAPVPIPHDGSLALRVPVMFALAAR